MDSIEELKELIKETSEKWNHSKIGENNCAASRDMTMMKIHSRSVLRNRYLHSLLSMILEYKERKISKKKLMEFIDDDELLEVHRKISIEKSL